MALALSHWSQKKTIPPIILPGRGSARSLNSRVLQSPLAGVSDQIFRGLIRRWAPEALLFTEMINATSLELGHGRSKVEELRKEKGPIGVQLFDYRPKSLAEAAKKAEDAGAFLIDINMGCPVRKVSKKGGGSGLLKKPELAEEVVQEVVNAVKIPVSVKMRLGWCEKSANPISFSRRLQMAGAQLLTVHGRTRKQGFSGSADWNAIRRIKEAIQIPVIANGDITNPQEALKCLMITQADGVMIGRGSLGSPWLVGEIDAALRGQKIVPPTPLKKVSLAKEHLIALLDSRGTHGLLVARKHMNWTCNGFPGANELRQKLMSAQTPSEALSLLDDQIEQLNNHFGISSGQL